MSGSCSEGSEGTHLVLMYDDARPRPYLVDGLYQQLPLVNSRQGVRLLLSSEDRSLTLLKELDTCNGTSLQTYTPCTTHVGDLHVLAAHVDYMNGQNINVPTALRNLPSFYWLPKMHKNPIGSRFIAASSACTTKTVI